MLARTGRSQSMLTRAVLLAFAALAAALLWTNVERASANPATGITAVAGGEVHTCALTTGGGVKCWGDNGFGQLGDGTFTNSSIPIPVPGLGSGVAQLDSGERNSCVVTTTGGVKCWGNGFGGTPTDVTGLTSGVASVSVGNNHRCVVTTTGAARCWGSDSRGQLGDGPGGGSGVVDVSGLGSGVAAVAAGLLDHSCALTTGGAIKCWGDNSFGQLGATSGEMCDNHSCSTTPLTVTGFSSGGGAVSLGREYSCALTSGGAVKCWGLGFGTSPVTVAGLGSGVVAVSAGAFHFCAVTTGGGLKCQGQNAFGQIGDGTTTLRTTPVNVLGLSSGVAQVSPGFFHTCAVVAGGGAKCWGFNAGGQLGNGTTTGFDPNPKPLDVVQTQAKSTPTPTPCPLSGCPTVPPTPTPGPQTGLDFSIGVDIDGNTVNDCGTRIGEPTKCAVPEGSAFKVRVFLNSLPIGVPQYVGFDIRLDYAGVGSKNRIDMAWPDCALTGGPFFASGLVAFGCGIGIGAPSSSYVGLLAAVSFNCSQAGTVSLTHGSGATTLVDPIVDQYHEAQSGQETLTINCAVRPVGGISLDPDARLARAASRPTDTALFAGAAIAGLLLLGGGVWCWLRRG